MSEYFERLDTNNYNSEFEYYLQNDFYTFEEWRTFYKSRKITKEQWQCCLNYFKQQKELSGEDNSRESEV